MFLEAPESRIVSVFISESLYLQIKNGKDLTGNYEACKNKLSGTEYEIVADAVFEKMSDTVTPQGIAAVVKSPEYSLNQILSGAVFEDEKNAPDFLKKKEKRSGLYLVLENIRDPGNLGTIFRTAEAAGVGGIILSEGCVDLYNPKVIRSTMGAVYRMPYIYVKSLCETVKSMKEAGITVYAATLSARSNVCYDNDYCNASAFLIGNEANGLSAEAIGVSDREVFIPMLGQGESLNASVAAAVLMFEAARQRRIKGRKNE